MNNPNHRICRKLHDDLIEVGNERVKKDLLRAEDMNFVKMTELLIRTKGYQTSLHELKTARERSNNE